VVLSDEHYRCILVPNDRCMWTVECAIETPHTSAAQRLCYCAV
jgi:hypothetical protein